MPCHFDAGRRTIQDLWDNMLEGQKVAEMTQAVPAKEVRAAGGLDKWMRKQADKQTVGVVPPKPNNPNCQIDKFRNFAISASGITLTFSFPPSVNHYWRHVALPLGKGKKGFRVQALISAEGRQYKNTVCREVKAQKAAFGITTPVTMSVVLCPPDRRRRDVDNYAKALLDSLVEAKVLQDDSQVRDLRLVWGEVTPGGKVVVTIRKMAVPPEQGVLI